ncbi:MAG: polyprenyl synthetase family protein [Anaerolineae bacterium]
MVQSLATRALNKDVLGHGSEEDARFLERVSHYIFDEALHGLDWPDLIAVIKFEQALIHNIGSGYGTILPIQTCVAVGGEAETAVPLAAAWLLYNLASDIFDDLQDQDGKERPWNAWEPARAMNVGLGLIAVANQCLARLPTMPDAHRDILNAWAQTFALAARGQSNVGERPSLETYFRQTIAKSGLIYATVARAGARLGTCDSSLIDAMYDYGYALGMVVQIVDDCRDLAPGEVASDLANGAFTLPVIYALSQKEANGFPELSALSTASGSLSSEDLIETT